MSSQPSPAVDSGAVVFRLTTGQQRRFRVGLVGAGLIVWSLGLVRLVVTGRFGSEGVVPTLVLTVAVAIVVVVVARLERVVVLADDAVHARWGPWRSVMPWSEVDAIDERDRGLSRRVAIHVGRRTRVLPVPLTGGSILGPGPDPGLDEKLDLIRRWWLERHTS
jgi:hypothetical protein